MLALVLLLATALPPSSKPGWDGGNGQATGEESASHAAGSPRLESRRIAHPPVIDGHLDDDVWRSAPSSTTFTQKFPHEGEPPSDPTTIRVVYDDQAIYIAIDCEQRHAPVLARLMRRDREAEGEDTQGRGGRSHASAVAAATDRVTVHIGSRGDRVSAFAFGINAAGVLSDGLHYEDNQFSSRWDETWEGEAARTPRGWSAELRIPLRALRFQRAPVQTWDFNVRRYVAHTGEIDEWAFTPREEAGVVSKFGALEPLQCLAPASSLELRPFVLGEAARRDAGTLPATSLDPRVSAGLDAKWHPSQETTLDLTLRPDFGQVEVDQLVLNLGTFEVFLPERRPFFVEGLDDYVTPFELVYTRRLGRLPGAPALADGEALAAPVRPTPILAAAKLSARPLPRLQVAAMSAWLGENRVAVTDAGGTTSERVVDPASIANVLRLKTPVGRGHIGFLGTALSRLESSEPYAAAAPSGPGGAPRVLCPSGAEVDAGARCFRDAYVGSLDGRVRSRDGGLYLAGQAFGTQIVNGPERTLADGTVLGAGARDVGGRVDVGRDGGRWLWAVRSGYVGRRLDWTDLGFQFRQNNLHLFADAGHRSTQRWWRTLETRTFLRYGRVANLSGQVIGHSLGADSEWTLDNLFRVGLGVAWEPGRVDDREIRGSGAAIERPRAGALWTRLASPSQLPVVAALTARAERRQGGGQTIGAEAALLLRALPQLDLDLLTTLTSTRGETRWVASDELGADRDRFLFGKLRAGGIGATLRATWSFTPRLLLSGYTQLFLSYRSYADYRAYVRTGPRPEVRLAELVPSSAPEDPPDDQGAALNATIVLRWEYMLGSVLYLVYSRSQVPQIDLAPGALPGFDLRALDRAPATDTVLVKLSYFWG